MNEHGSIEVLIVRQPSGQGIQMTFPDAIAELLQPYINAEGTLKTGLILTKGSADQHKFTLTRRNGESAYRTNLSARQWAGVDVTETKIAARVSCVVLKEAAQVKVLLDEIDVSKLPTRKPRYVRIQQQQPALPLTAPKPTAGEPDEMEQLKQALVYIRSAGSRPLWQAIVTVFRLANKQHIRLRLTDEGLKATREVEV